jgi:hypothetical protein
MDSARFSGCSLLGQPLFYENGGEYSGKVQEKVIKEL